jgi:nucleoside-diphosphate-sugar epimerase
MTALITGGAGLIGSYIANYLVKNKIVDKVVLIDHFGRYTDSLNDVFIDYRKYRFKDITENIIVERGDASNYSIIHAVLDAHRPKYIFHLAALPLAKIPNLNPVEAEEGSIGSTINILDSISQLAKHGYSGPDRFVYASSSMVYGDFLSEEPSEDHPTNPKEIYGTMKLAGEVITKGLGGFYGVPYTIIRPSAVYGPTDMNRRVTQIFIEKAMLNQKITVAGRDEKLDFTYVKDIARGFVMAALSPNGKNQVLNITNGNAHTLLEYVECLKKYFPGLNYEITERDAFRPKRGTLSIQKAKSLIGYEPEFTLDMGVEEYVNFILQHHPLAK